MEYEAGLNTVLQEDLERIVETIDLSPLSGKSVLVTGATGLIGKTVVLALLCANRVKNLSIEIVAFARNKEKYEKVFANVRGRTELISMFEDVTRPIKLDYKVDYIIHGASVTASKYFVERPVETMVDIIEGAKNILTVAHANNIISMVHLSSCEVYGDASNGDLREEDLGRIEPSRIRNSYPMAKLAVECLCSCYASEYAVPVKVARLSQTFGAGVEYDDPRVFGEFARCVIESRDIILHTTGETKRCYCYLADAVTAIFTILLRGNNGEIYNVANPDAYVSITDMAKIAAQLNKSIAIKFDIDKKERGYLPVVDWQTNCGKLCSVGWHPEKDIVHMYDRVVKSFIADGAIQ